MCCAASVLKRWRGAACCLGIAITPPALLLCAYNNNTDVLHARVVYSMYARVSLQPMFCHGWQSLWGTENFSKVSFVCALSVVWWNVRLKHDVYVDDKQSTMNTTLKVLLVVPQAYAGVLSHHAACGLCTAMLAV